MFITKAKAAADAIFRTIERVRKIVNHHVFSEMLEMEMPFLKNFYSKKIFSRFAKKVSNKIFLKILFSNL